MAWAGKKVSRRLPLLSVRLGTDQQTKRRMTPPLLVGNNEYQLDCFNVRIRTCLNNGRLALDEASTQSRLGMLRLTFRALTGSLNQDRDFDSVCQTECWIETHRRWLHVAMDDEVVRIQPPLQ